MLAPQKMNAKLPASLPQRHLSFIITSMSNSCGRTDLFHHHQFMLSPTIIDRFVLLERFVWASLVRHTRLGQEAPGVIVWRATNQPGCWYVVLYDACLLFPVYIISVVDIRSDHLLQLPTLLLTPSLWNVGKISYLNLSLPSTILYCLDCRNVVNERQHSSA